MVVLKKFPDTARKDFGERVKNRPKKYKDGKSLSELIEEAAMEESDNGRCWWIEQYIRHAYKKKYKSTRR